MTIRIGETAPDFLADTTAGPLDLHSWAKDHWVLFFSHPADFTPVCTSEFCRSVELEENFSNRGVKLLGLSADSKEHHIAWLNDIKRLTQISVNFPVIADPDCRIARLYEMIHPLEMKTAAIRALFIIDPTMTVRLSMSYPMSVGRNFDEILRVVDALQLADEHQIATPADWRRGDPVLIPSAITNEDAENQFPQGWQQLKPYYRLTVVKPVENQIKN
ncbi:MAG: peroxiredoxin [Granulosicoccaceae bacterium]